MRKIRVCSPLPSRAGGALFLSRSFSFRLAPAAAKAARHGLVFLWGQPYETLVEFSIVKKGRRIVVTVGGVDNVENSVFAVLIRENAIRKPVEKLSTYPHRRWITRGYAEIVGTEQRVLRRASTAGRIVPISPTRCARIIHTVGDLSTENSQLSPSGVESGVLAGLRALVKWRRTYYALVGTAMNRTGRPGYPQPQLSTNRRCGCG